MYALICINQYLVLSDQLENLRQDMLHRKQQAFTQGTTQNHTSQIRLYVSFCIHFGLRDIDPEPDTVCLYIEFLAQNLKSPKSVANYISSAKFLHKWLGRSVQAFESFEVSLLLRACNLTMGHTPGVIHHFKEDLSLRTSSE